MEGDQHDARAPIASKPAFSVVVPLFNKRDHVRRTIRHILDQDYTLFEVIVVDDGSTDDSVAQIADLVGPKLRILHQPNAGPGAARNLGIADARHEWIAFIDADDAWYPDHLSELSRAITAFPAARFASTTYRKRSATEVLPPRGDAPAAARQLSYFEACRHRNIVWTSTIAIRRDVFDRIGGFKTIFPGEDTDMWVRAGLEGPLAFSPRVTAIYTMNTGGLSETHANIRRSAHVPQRTTLDNPLYALLDEKLSDPTMHPLHAAIRTYADARLITVCRNAIFDGDRLRAQEALKRVHAKSGRRYLTYKTIAHLPAPIFIAARTLWQSARRRLGRNS